MKTSRKYFLLMALTALILLLAVSAGQAEIASGTHGTCDWVIEDDGTLRISPTDGASGTLMSGSGNAMHPWTANSNAGKITSLVIEEGVKAGTSMSDLFTGLTNLRTADVSNLDTSAATNMYNLFGQDSNLDTITGLDKWDTSNVINMSNTFYVCSNLISLDLSKWDTEKVETFSGMFNTCSLLESLNVSGWDTSSTTRMNNMFTGCNKLETLDLNSFKTEKVTSFEMMFYNCRNLKTVSWDNTKFKTDSATTLRNMFYQCYALTNLDVSKWNTSKVQNMNGIFGYCYVLANVDVSNWDTSAANQMYATFMSCRAMTEIDTSRWDTCNVTTMESMFYDCRNLTDPKVQNFDITDCTTIRSMFEGCTALTSLDLSAWGNTTSKLLYVTSAFSGCTALASLNVSGWNTGKVTNMANAFYNCRSLTELDLSSWSTKSIDPISDRNAGSTGGLQSMFVNTVHLKKITFGSDFSLKCTDATTSSGAPSGVNAFLPAHTYKQNGTGWTGKWINTATQSVYTPAELISLGYSLAGTYMWEGQVTFYKRDKDNRNALMSGVTFTADGKTYTTAASTNTTAGTIQGAFTIDGLYEGKEFTLTEMTPADYKAQEPFTIKIDNSTDRGVLTSGDGWLMKVLIDGAEAAAPVTIYNEQTKYKVTYDANGGSGTAPTDATEYVKNATVTVKSANGLTWEKHQFKNWNTKADGTGTSYNPNATFAIQGDTTLYAQWDELVTVKFDTQGGTPQPADQTFVKGGKATTPTNPTKDGYTFEYWYLDDENTAYNFNTAVNTDITLTAKWKLWADGKICLEFRWLNPDTWRNQLQYPHGGALTLGNLAYYSDGAAELYDSSGNLVESYVGEATHTFSNLPADTYTIKLTILDRGIYHIFESIKVSSSTLIESETSQNLQVTVTAGNATTINRYVALEYKAYGFKTVSELGTFSNGTKEKVYYTGGNWSFPNTDASQPDVLSYGTHNGIYYNDSADLYSGMNSLEVPTLSAADEALGYYFVGWKLEGDTSGKIYSETEALSYIVRQNVVFEAVWGLPTRTVTFLTDLNKGTITGGENGGEALPYTFKGNFSLKDKANEVPTDKVVEKDGWRFVGWYSDPGTTNVIPDSEILNAVVTEDMTYYAKYEPLYTYTVTYSDGAGGTVFEDKQFTDLNEGDSTPSFGSDPARSGWKFLGWTPEVAQTVTGNVVYFATWAPLTAEDAEYTVIYTDDVGRVAFEDMVFTGLKTGDDTPQYPDTPTWEGFTFVEWNPEVSDTVNGNAVYFAAWKKNEPTPTAAPGKYTVIFDPADHGELLGRGTHQVPKDEHVPLVPGIDATDPYTFVERWEVIAVDGETDGFIQVGDVLNEANISHLSIRYNVTFRALYETSEPTPTPEPTKEPTAAPTNTPRPTAKPTDPPAPTGAPNYFYFSFTKEWLGDPGEEISFTLYHSNGTVRNHRFNRKKISDTEWLYEAWLSTGDDYYVIEDRMSDYSTRYVNIGTHAEDTTRVYNGGKIINSVIPKTGDSSNPVLWGVLSGTAVLALGMLLILSRKKKNRQHC